MNPIRRILRIAGILAGLACAWIGLAAAAPAAFAMPRPGGPPASRRRRRSRSTPWSRPG